MYLPVASCRQQRFHSEQISADPLGPKLQYGSSKIKASRSTVCLVSSEHSGTQRGMRFTSSGTAESEG